MAGNPLIPAILIAVRSEPGQWTLSALASDLGVGVDDLFSVIAGLLRDQRIRVNLGKLHPPARYKQEPLPGSKVGAVLREVRRQPGQTAREIQGSLEQTRRRYPAVSAHLTRLKRRGLVSRTGWPCRWVPVEDP